MVKLYYPKLEGDEYYNTNRYIIKNNVQIYAKRKDNSEHYLIINDEPVFAKKNGDEYYASKLQNEIYPRGKDGKCIYAKKANNDEIYAKDDKGSDIYPVPFHRYAKQGGKYVYARDKNFDEFYYKDKIVENGDEKRYAQKLSGEEIYPINIKTGKPKYIVVDDDIVYAKDANGNFVYFKTDKGEVYGKLKDKETYITDDFGVQKYAKDENGKEYCAKVGGTVYYAMKLHNGKLLEYLPLDENKKPYFAIEKDCVMPLHVLTDNPTFYKQENGKDVYQEMQGKQWYAVSKDYEPVYAKLESGDDYLAKNNEEEYYAEYQNNQYYPKMKSLDQFYLNKHGNEIYAKKGKNEFYARDRNKRCIIAKNKDTKQYYAQTEKEGELYPDDGESQFYRLEDADTEICAKNAQGLFFYAQDKNKQEFYPKKKAEDPMEVVDDEIKVDDDIEVVEIDVKKEKEED